MGTEESKKRPLVFAYYVTGHGFGHATRVVEAPNLGDGVPSPTRPRRSFDESGANDN